MQIICMRERNKERMNEIRYSIISLSSLAAHYTCIVCRYIKLFVDSVWRWSVCMYVCMYVFLIKEKTYLII